MKRLLPLVFLVVSFSAQAHGGSHDPTSPWSLEAWVAFPLLCSATLYAIGVVRLWLRLAPGRGVKVWQAASFACGWLLLVMALVSPMHALGEKLFTAHMLEHEILMAVAAPLLVVARPIGGMLWGLPQTWRKTLGSLGRYAPLANLWQLLVDPLVATSIHGAAIWLWHIPLFFEAALANPFVHGLQHVSFLGSALLFWWALLRGRTRTRGYGVAAFYLFLTALHSGFLGVLLSIAREPIYPDQSSAAAQWGLTPLEDQQLAGLIMWVPAGFIYAAATLVMLGIWIHQSSILPMRGGGHAPLSH